MLPCQVIASVSLAVHALESSPIVPVHCYRSNMPPEASDFLAGSIALRRQRRAGMAQDVCLVFGFTFQGGKSASWTLELY